MHYDDIISKLMKMKEQDDGFVEEINKLSKRNAELTHQINTFKTKNDNLYEEINDSYFKIKDYEQKIYEIKVMLDNAMADKALDAEKICQLKNLLENEIERKAIKEQTIDWHEERIEQLLHRNDALVDENGELSKRNAELTQKNDKLETKNDSLYRELNQAHYKIQDYERKIHQLEGMVDNAMADTALDKKAINGLEGKVEELLHRNDDLIDENEELKKASNLIIERHEHVIEQLTEEEDDDYHGITKHRYSYGQNKAFMAFAIANNIPEPTLHKFYEALLKLEDGFDPDAPSAAETNYNNLLENLEHLVNCHAVSNSLTVKLNENKGE